MTFARDALLFAFIAVFLTVPSVLYAITCPQSEPKINCSVNGSITEACGKCPQLHQKVTPGEKTPSTETTQTGNKNDCDIVTIVTPTGTKQCAKEGIQGGRKEEGCTVTAPTCQSLLDAAEQAMLSGGPNVSGADQNYLDALKGITGQAQPQSSNIFTELTGIPSEWFGNSAGITSFDGFNMDSVPNINDAFNALGKMETVAPGLVVTEPNSSFMQTFSPAGIGGLQPSTIGAPPSSLTGAPLFNNFVSGFSGLTNPAIDAGFSGASVFNDAVSFDGAPATVDWGANAGGGFLDGISNAAASAYDTMSNTFSSMMESAKATAQSTWDRLMGESPQFSETVEFSDPRVFTEAGVITDPNQSPWQSMLDTAQDTWDRITGQTPGFSESVDFSEPASFNYLADTSLEDQDYALDVLGDLAEGEVVATNDLLRAKNIIQSAPDNRDTISRLADSFGLRASNRAQALGAINDALGATGAERGLTNLGSQSPFSLSSGAVPGERVATISPNDVDTDEVTFKKGVGTIDPSENSIRSFTLKDENGNDVLDADGNVITRQIGGTSLEDISKAIRENPGEFAIDEGHIEFKTDDGRTVTYAPPQPPSTNVPQETIPNVTLVDSKGFDFDAAAKATQARLDAQTALEGSTFAPRDFSGKLAEYLNDPARQQSPFKPTTSQPGVSPAQTPGPGAANGGGAAGGSSGQGDRRTIPGSGTQSQDVPNPLSSLWDIVRNLAPISGAYGAVPRQQGIENGQTGATANPNPQPSFVPQGEPIVARVTFYAPGAGGKEGPFKTSQPNLEREVDAGKDPVPRTLDDVREGLSGYVTLASHPDNYRKYINLGDVTYRSPKDGKTYTLPDVVGYVHDTGDAFSGRNADRKRYDIAVGDFRPANKHPETGKPWTKATGEEFVGGKGQEYGWNAASHTWQPINNPFSNGNTRVAVGGQRSTASDTRPLAEIKNRSLVAFARGSATAPQADKNIQTVESGVADIFGDIAKQPKGTYVDGAWLKDTIPDIKVITDPKSGLPKKSGKMSDPKGVVIHYAWSCNKKGTVCNTDSSAQAARNLMKSMKNDKRSYHVYVTSERDENGNIIVYQGVPFDRGAVHVTDQRDRYADRDLGSRNTIGISCVGAGATRPCTAEQIDAVARVYAALNSEYGDLKARGHAEIQYKGNARIDPWTEEFLDFIGAPDPIRTEQGVVAGEGAPEADFLRRLTAGEQAAEQALAGLSGDDAAPGADENKPEEILTSDVGVAQLPGSPLDVKQWENATFDAGLPAIMSSALSPLDVGVNEDPADDSESDVQGLEDTSIVALEPSPTPADSGANATQSDQNELEERGPQSLDNTEQNIVVAESPVPSEIPVETGGESDIQPQTARAPQIVVLQPEDGAPSSLPQTEPDEMTPVGPAVVVVAQDVTPPEAPETSPQKEEAPADAQPAVAIVSPPPAQSAPAQPSQNESEASPPPQTEAPRVLVSTALGPTAVTLRGAETALKRAYNAFQSGSGGLSELQNRYNRYLRAARNTATELGKIRSTKDVTDGVRKQAGKLAGQLQGQINKLENAVANYDVSQIPALQRALGSTRAAIGKFAQTTQPVPPKNEPAAESKSAQTADTQSSPSSSTESPQAPAESQQDTASAAPTPPLPEQKPIQLAETPLASPVPQPAEPQPGNEPQNMATPPSPTRSLGAPQGAPDGEPVRTTEAPTPEPPKPLVEAVKDLWQALRDNNWNKVAGVPDGSGEGAAQGEGSGIGVGDNVGAGLGTGGVAGQPGSPNTQSGISTPGGFGPGTAGWSRLLATALQDGAASSPTSVSTRTVAQKSEEGGSVWENSNLVPGASGVVPPFDDISDAVITSNVPPRTATAPSGSAAAGTKDVGAGDRTSGDARVRSGGGGGASAGGGDTGGNLGGGGGASSNGSPPPQPPASSGGFFRGGVSLLGGLLQGVFAWFGGQDTGDIPSTPSSPPPPQAPQRVEGAIVANPALIDEGTRTELAWSSVGTDGGPLACAIVDADFDVIHRAGPNGTTTSPLLYESTRFGLVCNVANATEKLLHETLVRVRGDDTDPPPIFGSAVASSTTGVVTGGSGSGTSSGGTNSTAGGAFGGSGGQSGNPAPEDVRTCDPDQSIDSFIYCLCEAEPNPAGCTIPPGGLKNATLVP